MSSDRWSRDERLARLPASAFRPSALFLAFVALTAATGWMLWTGYGNERLNAFGFVVAGWLVTLCLHEYAHARLAYQFGDRGVAQRGYLTLNPVKYSHPLLSIILPVLVVVLGGIGLPGGAVWVDHAAIRGRLRHTLVSLAGPAVNLAGTLALVLPFAIGVDVFARPAFWAAVALLGFLQLTASLLNLLPVPGLDGGNMLHPWLSPRWRRGYDLVAPFGFILLFVLLWNPRIGGWFFTAVFAVGDLIGLPRGLYALGFELIRFWS